MRWTRLTTRRLATVVALLGYAIAGPSVMAQAGSRGQDRAVATIEEHGGSVERDESKPGKPVIEVHFGPDVDFETPESTEAALSLLKEFTDLRRLSLVGTGVDDAGLA